MLYRNENGHRVLDQYSMGCRTRHTEARVRSNVLNETAKVCETGRAELRSRLLSKHSVRLVARKRSSMKTGENGRMSLHGIADRIISNYLARAH
jgi:hypothetical protein